MDESPQITNLAVKAHGMDGTLVEPDWPPLTIDELRHLLRLFPDCGQPIGILHASPRPFSAASVVATDRGRFFVKRHHPRVRDREGLLEEHRFIDHLVSRGAPVPRVLATALGESVIDSAGWIYEVHATAAGIDLYRDALSWTPFRSIHHARSAGEILARLHRAADGFSSPPRKPRPLVASFTIFASQDPNVELKRYLVARPALSQNPSVSDNAREALALIAPFHAELLPFLPSLQPLWTHNDLHASNLLWNDSTDHADAAAVIDFGLADRTNAVHDLAHAIERNIVGWLALVEDPGHPENVPVHFDHLRALLDGYQSVRPLTHAEAHALAPMAALCHAEFALSEAEYFLSILHSQEKAAMAHDGWLVGHARWFHSVGGSKVLDALRAFAA